ncbi:Scr1 family TA system antitoxin-like transcriptional regulator [Streptomyces sp. NPDC048411]|uniref:helix-turn-helix domain-containing protein n=1 Tax=Streptomyces sp. NPDC048411 TaxID=3157206 RepID=UPI003452EC7C
MPQPKELDPYTNPRAFYGSELRRLREAAGLSQDQLGERVFCSGSYIGQFESANRRPQIDMSRIFDQLFGSGEHLERLCRLARKSKVASYFADAAELQERAKSIEEYSSLVVPGLLQTEAYTRALTQAAQPFATSSVVRRRGSRKDPDGSGTAARFPNGPHPVGHCPRGRPPRAGGRSRRHG